MPSRVSAPIADIEGVNSRWQEEDSRLSLAEARLKAHRAFARRLTIIASILLERWDKELEKIARYDGMATYPCIGAIFISSQAIARNDIDISCISPRRGAASPRASRILNKTRDCCPCSGVVEKCC